MGTAFGSAIFWLDMLFVVGICFVIDFLYRSIEFDFFPSICSELQKLVCERGSCEEEVDMPFIIQKKLKLYDQYQEEADGANNHHNKPGSNRSHKLPNINEENEEINITDRKKGKEDDKTGNNKEKELNVEMVKIID